MYRNKDKNRIKKLKLHLKLLEKLKQKNKIFNSNYFFQYVRTRRDNPIDIYQLQSTAKLNFRITLVLVDLIQKPSNFYVQLFLLTELHPHFSFFQKIAFVFSSK